MQRQTTEPPPKKIRTSTACEACRAKKKKCDGNRPKCASCIMRAIDCYYGETESRVATQRYSELRMRKTTYEELIDLLRTLPSDDATKLLGRLRTEEDPTSLLRQIQTGDLLIQLSVAPETRRRYEFPYLSNMPSSLIVSGNSYLESIIFATTWKGTQHFQTITDHRLNKMWDSDAYTKPYHAAKIAEPLLSDVDISKWTSVTSDNKLLRELLSQYLLSTYNVFLPFPKDLFLEDLASGCANHCSSLLVNVVLAAACSSYQRLPNRGNFWMPESLLYKFLAESRMLWELESVRKPCLTTIQAAYTMSTIMSNTGIDKLGWRYMLQAITIGEELGIFQSSASICCPKEKRARVWTAWSVWWFQVELGYYYFHKPPHLERPPVDPLPNPTAEPDWYGETWLQYPQSGVLIPIHLGHNMKLRCDLNVIKGDIATDLLGSSSHFSLERARYYHDRLEAWYQKLPAPYTSQQIFTISQFLIHLEYCNIVISLFEPYIGATDVASTIDSTRSPTNIVRLAEAQFETAFRLYYLRHSFKTFDGHLMMYAMVLANRAAKVLKTTIPASDDSPQAKREELRSTLVLCGKALRDQADNFYLANLMCLALGGMLEPEDLQLLSTCVSLVPDIERPSLPQHELLNWPLPIVRMDEEPSKAVLASLVQQFKDMESATKV
ncbi:hypothetical protein COCC4DRAFT_155428 [Bipolaris maydis ATCC 48331]|uniref:Zn(2)-C6 fungal-type domain-containing protein n=2 Tax=Cochliobolus heterostrophus TaxID=5016 RepID=M2UEL0_COCH5|nr:uncharacterized protein COCC4DRAFT_155428 [Bipolaris maydis ATCC 48331]EMD84689.1 hypothetical protein COCHEDRAFT_1122213 [Bipolaris maydis C5]KAJ5021998.1 hypothetical protein J3E73DRAFT_401543 [Bipolaris maydis]EMD92136.1 hypothetical protein COCHEDRAFT_1100899 [Bipolaris maydis C5]ENH98572.1 hypothetical protein COCC4DRAFT_155428 [Bipolaris maydis ATCC 48331]KAJ6272505.1 hypothetical protein PSV08DRAFT_389066 [Bipolaris maydis]